MLYERRLQLLDVLDDFTEEAFYDAEYTMDENDPKITIVRKQFADVLNPADIEKSLKEIYPEHLYKKRQLM